MRSSNIRRFPAIDSRAWEHPADRAALRALEQLKGVDELVKILFGNTSEKMLRQLFFASSVKVTERQFPKLHGFIKESCEILDVVEVPELFVMQTPQMNAFTLGVKTPFIVLNSALVQHLSEEEVLGVVAHELGHVASGHAKYKTVIWLLAQFAVIGAMSTMGGAVTQLLVQGLIMALREWDRKSELSADRAGLLVIQDPSVSYNILMRLAGGAITDQMSMDEFFAQADEYEKGGDLLDNIFKILNLLGQSHPFPVLRVSELRKWIDSGAYGKIMEGDYIGRNRGDRKMEDDFKEAASGYQKDFEQTARNFQSAFSSVGKDLEKAGKDVEAFFKGMFGG